MVRAETVASTVVHSTLLNPARTKTTTHDVVNPLRFASATIEPRIPMDALATEDRVDQLVLVLGREFQQASTVVVATVTFEA